MTSREAGILALILVTVGVAIFVVLCFVLDGSAQPYWIITATLLIIAAIIDLYLNFTRNNSP